MRAWPEAVGEQIARNAWPARLSRDGTLHVATSSSAWAFELAQLEPKLLEPLREALGDGVPAGLALRSRASSPSPPPEETCEPSEAGSRADAPRSLETAAALAAGIDDESLRKIVAKAAACEPLESPLTAARSGTLPLAQKGKICRAFFNG